MKRVALLSTWNEICGIAHYSAFLKRALEQYVNIDVIAMPRDIIHGAETKDEIKAADALIDRICAQLSQYDVACIQFEPGLFGRTTQQQIARIKRIIASSPDIVIAFHHFPRQPNIQLAGMLRPLHPMVTIRNLLTWRRIAGLERQWKQFWRALDVHASTGHRVAAIAHTKTDARYLAFKLPNCQILDGPLTYMDDEFVNNIDQLAQYSSLASLAPTPKSDTRFLGVFGFYSSYKGFETAISALKYLPSNYELLLFSGVHPSTLVQGQSTDTYLLKLMRMVEREKKLFNRVHFIGSVSDNDMLVGMMMCDVAVIPYLNSAHTSSGPASQVLELSRPTFMSRNRQFTEFAKYFPNQFEFFDIGNYLELAQKILRQPLGAVYEVNGIRMVRYPKLKLPVTVDDTIDNYLRGFGVSPHG